MCHCDIMKRLILLLFANWAETIQISIAHKQLLLHLCCDITECFCVCAVFTTRTAVAHTPALEHVTGMSSSGEGLQSAAGGDLESDDDQDPSGMFSDPALFRGTESSGKCTDI